MGIFCSSCSGNDNELALQLKKDNSDPQLRVIQSTNTTFDGYLIPRLYRFKFWKGQPWQNIWGVNWIESLTAANKQASVLVYSYKSKPAANDGTYVVLQFSESKRYIFAKKKNSIVLAEAKDDSFTTPNAEDITTTADPRVFLKKVSGRDVMFASCVASQQQPNDKSKARFITLRPKKIKRHAKFSTEGNSSVEAQLFKVEDAVTESDESASDDNATTVHGLDINLG
uniref:Uncharacterized protein n=1 Tax=Branchiostoma floridae TaxID=7739 RepID=C3Y7E0_BRAFL|eukprot:XP_002607758.1 hypothetical protein BRAFLDRAFT_82793 [Branchiostoma floridae]